MGQIRAWADLPEELLSNIATFLTSDPLDICRFCSVCKSWNSSFLSLLSTPTQPLHLSPSLPQLLPPLPTSFTPPHPPFAPFCILSITTLYALKSPHASSPSYWLLFLDQWTPGSVGVRHPLSTKSFSMTLDFPCKLNLLDLQACKVGHYYNLSYGYYVGLEWKAGKPDVWSQGLLKVVFLLDQSAVFALSEDAKLGLLRLQSHDGKLVNTGEWEIIHDGKGLRFDDILEYKEKLLGIDRRGRVYEYDMGKNSSGMKVVCPPVRGGGGRRKRLIISSSGETLYLLVRCEKMGIIKVYKLTQTQNGTKWTEVHNIGDEVFLFGINFSLSASAQEFEGYCVKNCIMYEEHGFRKYDGRQGDSGLFHGSRPSSLKIGVYKLGQSACLQALDSCPCLSALLWPPPTWICLDDRSKRIGILETAINRVLNCAYWKARYARLSAVVMRVVSNDDVVTQQDVPIIAEEIDSLKNFISNVDFEIRKEADNIKRCIVEDAAARHWQGYFKELSDQVGTSNHGAEPENRNECIKCLENARAPSDNDEEWMFTEMRRRLQTHFDLSETLKGVVNMLEKHTNLKHLVKFHQLASISTVGKAPVSQEMHLY